MHTVRSFELFDTGSRTCCEQCEPQPGTQERVTPLSHWCYTQPLARGIVCQLPVREPTIRVSLCGSARLIDIATSSAIWARTRFAFGRVEQRRILHSQVELRGAGRRVGRRLDGARQVIRDRGEADEEDTSGRLTRKVDAEEEVGETAIEGDGAPDCTRGAVWWIRRAELATRPDTRVTHVWHECGTCAAGARHVS